MKGKQLSAIVFFFSLFQEKDHNSEDEDEDKYADDIDMPGQNFDSKRRITVRNLRIREDIAKVSLANLIYTFNKYLSSQPKFYPCLSSGQYMSDIISHSKIRYHSSFLSSSVPQNAFTYIIDCDQLQKNVSFGNKH